MADDKDAEDRERLLNDLAGDMGIVLPDTRPGRAAAELSKLKQEAAPQVEEVMAAGGSPDEFMEEYFGSVMRGHDFAEMSDVAVACAAALTVVSVSNPRGWPLQALQECAEVGKNAYLDGMMVGLLMGRQDPDD